MKLKSIKSSLYFDYQATTPVAPEVLAKMLPYFAESFANPHASDHVLGWDSAAAIDFAQKQLADFVGADSDEIIFTSGATESNNLALLGLAKRARQLGSVRNRILLSAIEHKCILAIGRVLQSEFGFEVEYVPVDNNGQVIAAELDKRMAADVLLVSIMTVNNEIGVIQDIAGLSGIVRKYGALFHTDGAQAPLALALPSIIDYVDALSISAHKMYGPKGVGVLYLRRDLHDQIEPLIYGGGQQNGLRSGTLPTPLCVGMGAAAEFIGEKCFVQLQQELSSRRDYLVKQLGEIHWPIIFNAEAASMRHPGNLSICIKGIQAQSLLSSIQPHVAASSGSACTSGTPESSHVLSAIGCSPADAECSIRLSLGLETTLEEIDTLIAYLREGIEKHKLLDASVAKSN